MSYTVCIKGGELLAAASIAHKNHNLLEHLLVEVWPCSYKIVATDEYSMVVIEREQVINADGRFLLPKDVTRGLKSSDTVKITVDDDKIKAEVYNRAFDKISSVEYDAGDVERYPKYEKLIKTAQSVTSDNATVNGDYLSTMTKAAKAVFGRNAMIGVSCHGRKPMEFAAHNDDTRFTGYIAPIVTA